MPPVTALRSLYGHWTQEVRKSKVGLLLRPNIDYDGDLAGATLPRRAPVAMTVGRGYLVHNGELPAVRVGRSFRVVEEDVNEYLRKSFYSAG